MQKAAGSSLERAVQPAPRADRPGKEILRETDISYNIRAIGRAIDVINVIAQSSEPLKLIEISAKSNLNKTTTLRILANLQQAGWVYRLEGDVYSLGFKLLAISQNVASSLSSYKAVRDAIVRVSRDTHETVRAVPEPVGYYN